MVAGSVEARHAAVSLRRHLKKTELIAGRVTRIDHAHKTVTVRPAVGDSYPLEYDIIVVTAGAVTRTLAIPGVTEHAIGMKHQRKKELSSGPLADPILGRRPRWRPAVTACVSCRFISRQGPTLAAATEEG